MKHLYPIHEYLFMVIILILGFLLWNPFDIYMLSMFTKIIVGLFLAILIIYLGLLKKERIVDERSIAHQHLAGRIAFSASILLLAGRLTYEVIAYSEIQSWILGALILIMFIHMGVKIYSKWYR